ncbi:MAG: hypothetical protein WAW17_26920 [Rhodococcus sp. (in: high G+C Gram-positive bacteria)]|uniref:hypothetical protein n=1 Tax=Rhodococcus sp. TaxID=1831 RepID=UPI003BB156FD
MTDTNFPRPDPTAGELARWYPSFTPATPATTDHESPVGPVEELTSPVSSAAPTASARTSSPNPAASRPVRRPMSPRLLAGGGAVAAVVAGLGVWALGGGQDAQPAAATARTPTAAPTSSERPHPWCDPASAVDGVVIGNGPGGTDSGPAAILAFDFAYYVQRSGEAARAVVTADAVGIDTTNGLQGAFDTEIPVGAQHCVTIRATTPERFLVTLRERRTSGEETSYDQQVITTRVVDGRHLIASIGKAS